ncbi:MAG: transposase [Candidatus Nealsonbacteria bacterium]|nr:transposase [Candidatus Nealsonbacteria bacterium]
MKNNNDKTTKMLENSIKSLRENLDSLSMDKFVATTIETLMNIERNEYLEEIDNPKKDKGNGYYERAMKTLSSNSLMVHIPRTRAGLFSPATLELLKINREKVDEIALSLYKRGMTSQDIQSFLDEVFAGGMSPSKIANLVSVFGKFRIAWQNAKLEKYYQVVFGDVIFVTVKRGNEYTKEGVFIAYGVREDNRRELLVLELNPTESAQFWGELLRDLKEKRGVEEIGLFIADGINYLEDEVSKIYPNADFQKCVVHKMRNILTRTSPKDKAEVSIDLKHIFDNFDKDAKVETALNKVDLFLEKWKQKYPNFKNYLKYPITNYKHFKKIINN